MVVILGADSHGTDSDGSPGPTAGRRAAPEAVATLAQKAVEDDPEAILTPSWWGPTFNREEAAERLQAELVEDGRVG